MDIKLFFIVIEINTTST